MHAQIEFQRFGEAKFTLDGQDITKHVMADGFGIEFDPKTRQAVVTMRLRPEKLTVEGEVKDLPEPLRLILDSAVAEGAEA